MTATPTTGDDYWSFVRELSTNAAAVETLLAVHVADVATGRCRACTRPGYGTPHVEWPCAPAALALMAVDIRNRIVNRPDREKRKP